MNVRCRTDFFQRISYFQSNCLLEVIIMTPNYDKETNGKEETTPNSQIADESVEDIAFEEVIPEDAPPRKNIPEKPTVRKPSGKHVPVE
jgi:hypothetical protein